MHSLIELAETLERAFVADRAVELETCVVWMRSAKPLADAIGHVTWHTFPHYMERWIEECIHSGSGYRVAMFSWLLEGAAADEVREKVQSRRSRLDAILVECLAEYWFQCSAQYHPGSKVDHQDTRHTAQRAIAENDLCPAVTALTLRAGPAAGPIADRLGIALLPYCLTGFFDAKWPKVLVV